MQNLIPVNIVIGDRSYRIRVEPKDEEVVRKIVRQVNDKILEFKTQFAGKDMQDYVSMVLLWFLTEQQSNPNEVYPQDLTDDLDRLEQLLDKTIKKPGSV